MRAYTDLGGSTCVPLILSVLFALAVIGAGVAVFAHEIPDFSHKHEDGEAIRKKA